MKAVLSMKCEFCGDSGAGQLALSDGRKVRACVRCAPLCANILTFENNGQHAREVMIGQHQNEPRRKLLELKNHSVEVFLEDTLEVVALEIEARRDRRVLKWRRGGAVREFVVNNAGRSYDNRDEMIPGSGFDVASLSDDIALSENNLHPRFRLAASVCLDVYKKGG